MRTISCPHSGQETEKQENQAEGPVRGHTSVVSGCNQMPACNLWKETIHEQGYFWWFSSRERERPNYLSALKNEDILGGALF